MRELILGGAGLIGSELVRTLQAQGNETRSLDLATGCDLRQEAPQDAFTWADRIWFLAWDTGGARYLGDPQAQHQIFRNNCELSARVFQRLADARKPFLFVTSQLAGQRTAYGLTKLTGEEWARNLGGHIVRLWNTYGWERPDHKSHVITDLVLTGLRDGVVRGRTDGNEHRRFLYKSDCAAALIKIFDQQLPLADVAGPDWLSIREVAAEVAQQLGTEFSMGSQLGSELLVDPHYLPAGWQPKVTLADGIAQVIADARAHLETSTVGA